MRRRSLTAKERLRLAELHGWLCHICAGRIDPRREAWEIEHIIALAMGGNDDDDNRKPAHRKCHAPKTKDDMGKLAKAKRNEARHLGARRARRPIMGSVASGWRHKLDGTWERR